MAKTGPPRISKIRVDRGVCIGSASCVLLAADTFRLDDENKSVVIGAGRDGADAVLEAARACPTGAITVFGGDGERIAP